MPLNRGKCQYKLIRNKSYDDEIILNGVELKTSKEEKLLGVLIAKNISFNVHKKSIVKRQAKIQLPLLD